MDAQADMMEALMAKIEIKGTIEELQRISIFLENNFIKYSFTDSPDTDEPIGEWEEPIDWPIDHFLSEVD